VYASNDEQVATVDDRGVVTAVGAGTCEVSVYSDSSLVALYAVSVRSMPDVLNAALENDMLGVGETTRVIADVDDSLVSELTYQSDDPDVATVENGIVTAVGAGDCVITVSLDDLTAQCRLSVYAMPDSFEVALPVSEMEVGDEARIQITFPADTYGKAVYTSLKGKVTIDADGKVTAVEKGVDNIA